MSIQTNRARSLAVELVFAHNRILSSTNAAEIKVWKKRADEIETELETVFKELEEGEVK